MSTLTLVRHSQATFLGDNYDQLSPLGEEQARALGRTWVNFGVVFDSAYMGSLQRHRQTYEGVAEVYGQHGLPCPEPVLLPELDEHHAPWVMEQMLPQLAQQNPALGNLALRYRGGQQDAGRAYLKLYQQVIGQWVRGELSALPPHESWTVFRGRVLSGLNQIRARKGKGRNVVAFTSGGPVAVALGFALNLHDEQIAELSWIVRNASCSEFLFSEERFSLTAFNSTAHLGSSQLLTYV